MNSATLLLLAVFALAFAMLAQRMSRSILTAPMAFLGFGWLLSLLGLQGEASHEHALHTVAEVALILLLFLDAARIDIKALRERHVWPVRTLALGLPFSIVLGTIVGLIWLPDWPIVAIALVAAILAPTDAALGQAVIVNPTVPERLRRTLTIESGLNDGLALPFILMLASMTASMEQADTDWLAWLGFAAKQITLGPLVGLVFGLIGGWIFLQAHRRELTGEAYEGVAAIGLAGATYLAADLVGGNGFIAAFVAGLAFGNRVAGQCRFVYEFMESDGQLLTWGAFFLIGFGLMPMALTHLTLPMLGLILTSLFIVRPVAIWLSLVNTDAPNLSRLFIGWFGPRGLATALFALLVVPLTDHAIAEPVLAIAINAVWISAVLHGITANPGARWMGRVMERTNQRKHDQ